MRISRRAILLPNTIFHKMWRTHNKEFLLQPHQEKREYLFCVKQDIQKRCAPKDFVLHSYCLMSNHVHETGELMGEIGSLSEHMRRAHGRFGQGFNKRHQRKGAVAYDRPKTTHVENQKALMKCMFYVDCNPVRAGLISHPTDSRWMSLSSCRFYAYGEQNDFTAMLTLPGWYLELGSTPEQRQSSYRSLLDQYLVECGMKHDPKMGSGHFNGEEEWVEKKREELSRWLKNQHHAPPHQARAS